MRGLMRVFVIGMICVVAGPLAAQPAPPAAAPAAPAAPSSSSAGPAPAVMGAPPPAQEAFVKAVDEARATYMAGINDMVRGIARPRRAEALCRALPRPRVENWFGRLVTLTSSPGGRGVIGIQVAPKLVFATQRTEAADDKDRTLIEVRSPLFAAASALAVGDLVQFSGTLFPGGDDCFRELSKDVANSMTSPEFLLRLEAIRKVVPPPVNAVLSGQAQAMTLAQSGEFVRDSVDVIAGAVACGVEQRRVFATIIKVLIRASAGQPTEQRDNLISMMFAQPSQTAQTQENCPAKITLFERLEADASL